MLDWKILAASFVALLAIVSVLAGGFGTGLFSDIANKIGEWMETSPFGNFFETTEAGSDKIDIKFFPESFILKSDAKSNITSDDMVLMDFDGSIKADFENKTITLSQKNTNLIIAFPIQKTVIENLNLNKLSIKNIRMELSTGDWEITTDNGSVEVSGFTGTGLIGQDYIQLTGNITKLVRN